MKDKIKYLHNNYFYIILVFLSAFIVITAVYYFKDISPFGKNSLLTIDFFHQYGPMLGELYNRITKGYNLVYSFSMGMGLPFFRNFFNYLSSPFNLLLFLFQYRSLIMSYSLIIGLKAAFSAVTMYFYLSRKFNSKNLYFIPLSLLYAFSGYFVAYYWNIMWLDGMVLLPLIVLGIEKLVNEDKSLLYIVSLVSMMFANYFIAYMLCIFSVTYFIGYLIIYLKKIDFKLILKKIVYFSISSLIAGCLAALFLIPMYSTLKTISATGDSFPTSQYYSFTLTDFIFKHFSGADTTVLNSDISNGPNISAGILSIALFLLFIINPKIKIKIKLVYIFILAFLAFSFYNGQLDYIWHAFHVPNDLPFRYSFIYTFILIVISAYSLVNIKHLKFRYTLIVYILMMLLISSLYFLKYSNISQNMILLNFAALTVYFLLYCAYIYSNNFKIFIPGIFIVISILECFFVINNSWKIDQDINNFYNDYNDIQDVLSYVRKNDKSMYRVDKTNMLTFNDSSWYSYYGQTTFSSMEYKDLAYLQHVLGLPGNEINSFYYKQTTPVYDLMFNIKYIIGANNDDLHYSLLYKNNTTELYRNNYNSGLMFGVNKNIKHWDIISSNPFKIQNDFIKKSVNMNVDIFKKLEINNKETIYEGDSAIIKYTVKNPESSLYFYLNDKNIDFIIIDNQLYYYNDDYQDNNEVFDFDIFSIQSYDKNYIISTSSNEEYYTFYVQYNNYTGDTFYLYTMDNETFSKAFDILNTNQIDITDFKENLIEASCNFTDDMVVYTSIPYDTGWHVYVDNQKVDTFKIGNALLGFDIEKGYHEIKLKYYVPYFGTGTAVSLISFLILISYLIYKKNKSV